MLKKFILFCGVLVVATSCFNYNTPDKPEHLISKEDMAGILLDLKLIGAVTGSDKKILDSAKVVPEAYVYKKYNIDSVQFAESNAYYSYYMDDYGDIYQKVKDSLNVLKTYYQSILDEEKRLKKEKDSLAKIDKELEAIEIDEDELIQELEDIKDAKPFANKE